MPIIRNVKYRTIPFGKSEQVYREMAKSMRAAGESALIIDLTKNELGVLRFFTELTHLTIRGGGRKWKLDNLPSSLQDLCLLEVVIDTLDELRFLSDLRVLDYRLGNILQTSSLERLATLQVLHFLRVPNLESLEFLQNLENLELLKISDCTNLKRFSELRSLYSLRRVVLEQCQSLSDISMFASAPNLEDLILLEMKSVKPLDFESIVKKESLRRILPGIGKLNSSEFLEASKIIASRSISSYYGGDIEFFEVRHRKGDREFSLKIS